MEDRLTTAVDSNLLDNKIKVLLKEFNDKIFYLQVSEVEEIQLIYAEVFEKFFSTLNNPIFTDTPFKSDRPFSYEELNQIFFKLGQDLEILFRELNFLQKAVVRNFNSLVVGSEKVRSGISEIFYDLNVLSLFSSNKSKDLLYFSDTFKNLNYVESSPLFYSTDLCQFSPDAELFTLPIDSVSKHTITNVLIGSLSNTTLGNNHQLGALLRNNIKAMFDNNPDTWTEYEYVSFNSIDQPLILQLKIQLEKDSILNAISLSTVSFAGGTYPSISLIEVSLDGIIFTSVMDDIVGPVKYSDGRKTFSLEPSASGSGDIRKILFYPRKARYVNITFMQKESYLIYSSSGLMNRVAIGIKEMSFSGEEYKEKGELVSSKFLSTEEIKYASLSVDLYQFKGFYDIEHYISVDNGQTWIGINTIENFSKSNPEILAFNLLDPRSVTTETPVFTIRYKGVMKRDSKNFNSSSGIVKVLDHSTELITLLPGGNTFSILEKPIEDSFFLYNLLFGSVGNEKFFSFNPSSLIKRKDSLLEMRLSQDAFPSNSIVLNNEIIFVNYEAWARVDDLRATTTTTPPVTSTKITQTSPLMTGVAPGGGYPVTTSSATANYPGSNVFNGTSSGDTTRWLTAAATGSTSAWLQVINAAPVMIDYYSVTIMDTYEWQTASPKSWIFKGSNDGSSWTTLSTVSNQAWTAKGQTLNFSVSPARNSYIYYRLDNISWTGPFTNYNYGGIAELAFFISETVTTYPKVVTNNYGPTDQFYQFDYINNIIIFGDNITGKSPDGLIQFGIKREKANVFYSDPVYVKTNLMSDGVKENTQLYRLIPNQTPTENIILKKSSKIYSLGYQNIETVTVVEAQGILLEKKDYINGYTELTNKKPGEYSIDLLKGNIYSYNLSPPDKDIRVSITYSEKESIDDFTIKGNVISFNDSSKFISVKQTLSVAIPSATNVISLVSSGGMKYTSIVQNSLVFLNTEAINQKYFKKEVPYLGNGREFDFLLEADKAGAYTVDYYRGDVYLYTKTGVETFVFDFAYSNYYIHYNIGVQVPSEDITIDAANKKIKLSDNYALKMADKSFTGEVTRSLFKCEYDYAKEIQEGFKETESYITPFLNSYTISYIDTKHLK